MQNSKFIFVLLLTIISTTVFTTIVIAEDSMLKDKPYFTYRIETKNVQYEAKMNGVTIQDDPNAGMLITEEPVNQYMVSGKNRIALYLYPFSDIGFGNADISISLYVNQDEAPEDQKRLVGQISFKVSELTGDKEEDMKQQKGISLSMPTMRLDSSDDFKRSDNGDVIIHPPKLEPAKTHPDALYIYQDIELVVPFLRWGFLDADPIDFPDSFDEFSNHFDHYNKVLLAPLYEVYEKLYEQLKKGDIDGFLSHFEERNQEMNAALYFESGHYQNTLRKSIVSNLNNEKRTLKLTEFDYADPIVSDDKKLIKLGSDGLIYFEDEGNSIYSKYHIWFYQKDGKWYISR